MTTLHQAAQQALEALGLWASGRDMDAVALNDLIHRLETALAEPVQEPVQEPVAWGCFKNDVLQTELVGTKADVDFWVQSDEPHMQGMVAGPLYASPQRPAEPQETKAEKLREPLAPEVIEAAAAEAFGYEGGLQQVNLGDLLHFARVLEQRHGIGA